MNNLSVYCADVGSVKNNKFGWAASISSSGKDSGTSIDQLTSSVAKSLKEGHAVALGFECPLFVPIREDPMSLVKARNGEGNRSWSASAGSCVLAIGLVETIWILRPVKSNVGFVPPVYMDWLSFIDAGRGLFLWEAFVSGRGKGQSHTQDAEIAVDSFLVWMNDQELDNAIKEESVFSLIGAALIRSGWSADINLLSVPCLVVKAKQVT